MSLKQKEVKIHDSIKTVSILLKKGQQIVIREDNTFNVKINDVDFFDTDLFVTALHTFKDKSFKVEYLQSQKAKPEDGEEDVKQEYEAFIHFTHIFKAEDIDVINVFNSITSKVESE